MYTWISSGPNAREELHLFTMSLTLVSSASVQAFQPSCLNNNINNINNINNNNILYFARMQQRNIKKPLR